MIIRGIIMIKAVVDQANKKVSVNSLVMMKRDELQIIKAKKRSH
jgi:hypothetical protein